MQEYTRRQTIVANLPYVIMIITGVLTIAVGFDFSFRSMVGAGLYLVYGCAGAVWIMVFMCPYCIYYGTRQCPCGYGILSAKMVKKGKETCFSRKFKQHIPVIVPLWIIPVVSGGMALWQAFSWKLLALVLVFAVNSYLILPLMSRKHGCADCPQKDDCPWMS